MARCQEARPQLRITLMSFFQLFNCLSMIALTLAFVDSLISPQFFVLLQCILYPCSARLGPKFVNHLIVASPKLAIHILAWDAELLKIQSFMSICGSS